jgi:hypothetical protein
LAPRRPGRRRPSQARAPAPRPPPQRSIGAAVLGGPGPPGAWLDSGDDGSLRALFPDAWSTWWTGSARPTLRAHGHCGALPRTLTSASGGRGCGMEAASPESVPCSSRRTRRCWLAAARSPRRSCSWRVGGWFSGPAPVASAWIGLLPPGCLNIRAGLRPDWLRRHGSTAQARSRPADPRRLWPTPSLGGVRRAARLPGREVPTPERGVARPPREPPWRRLAGGAGDLIPRAFRDAPSRRPSHRTVPFRRHATARDVPVERAPNSP